jgi:hypothetical protein
MNECRDGVQADKSYQDVGKHFVNLGDVTREVAIFRPRGSNFKQAEHRQAVTTSELRQNSGNRHNDQQSIDQDVDRLARPLVPYAEW